MGDTPDERMEDALQKILQWCDAYPLDIFPEPDLKRAHEVLTANGMTLDSISAHVSRHVLRGIEGLARAAIAKATGGEVMGCTHKDWERESAVETDGMCPLCLAASNAALRTLLTDCADSLEAELNARYPESVRAYPCMQSDYERDMQVVVAARAALAKAQ